MAATVEELDEAIEWYEMLMTRIKFGKDESQREQARLFSLMQEVLQSDQDERCSAR